MNNLKSRLNTENGIEITSVGSFLEEINNLREKEEDYALKYFFRGQQVEFWDISSSIFRSGMLNAEHQLLKEPLEKFPNEFKNLSNTFDLMTKCQHYGLCTRLLDLTTNPLVALYFACQENGEKDYEKDPELEYKDDEIKDSMEPWGIIYYKKDYPMYSDDKKVKIITEMAKYNLQQDNSLEIILNKLHKNDIISQKELEDWNEDKFKEFVNIIQSTYVVQPTYNNTRLIAQSGAFLLPGMFSVTKNEISNSILTKCKGSLRKYFENKFFYISGENKKQILEELNICNINESTLFPELEHQLKYIKTTNEKVSFDAPDFEKFVEESINIDKSDIVYDKNPDFENSLCEYLESIIDKASSKDIYESIINQFVIDWYKKETIISKIKKNIIKVAVSNGKTKDIAYCIADNIVNEAKNLYKKDTND